MKNRFTKTLSVLAIATLSAFGAQAQTQRPSGIRYSIGADGGIPLSNLSDNYKWSLGGSIQADIPVLKNDLYVTINAGYNNIFANRDVTGIVGDIHLIPVKAGLKYFAAANFYIQGEAGVSFITSDGPLLEKSASFTWAPQLGYLIPIGGKSFIDAGVRYEGNSKFYDAGKTNDFLGLRVAYAFPLGKK